METNSVMTKEQVEHWQAATKPNADEPAQEVQAHVIDGLSELTGAERWLATQRTKVSSVLTNYAPHEITSIDDYKQSKRDRASARKAIKGIEDDRRAKTKAIKDVVSEFEANVRELLDPLKGIDSAYKHEIDAYERRELEAKEAAGAEFYADFAPDLTDLVPWERVKDVWSEAGSWAKMTVSVEQVRQDVQKHVQAIAHDEATIAVQDLPDEEREALRADYFSTLDLADALRRSAERQQQRKRVAELDAARQAREQVVTRPQYEPEPIPPRPAPTQPQEQFSQSYIDALSGTTVVGTTTPTRSPVPEFAMFCYVTREQRDTLIAFCRERGIHGKFVTTHGREMQITTK